MAAHTGRVTIFPSAAVTDKRLGAAAFRVLAALGRHGDKNGWCFPSLKTLADDLGVSRQAISKCLQQLAALGYVQIQAQTREDKSRTVNRYRVVLDFDSVDMLPRQPDVDTPTPDVDTPQLPEVDTPQPSYVDTPQLPEVDALTSHRNSPIRTTHLVNDVDVQFARFWAAYPKRKKKQEAQAWFARRRPSAQLVDEMIAALERAVLSEGWQKEDGRFIPLPVSWLNGRRWEDEEEVCLPAIPARPSGVYALDEKSARVLATTQRVLARRQANGHA